MKVREIVGKYESGKSMREISGELNISKTTVSNIIAKCKELGITSTQLTEENNGEMLALIYPRLQEERSAQKLEPNWEEVHKRLTSTRHNIKSLWTEYAEENPDGYQYSQFCQRYKDWKGVEKDVVMVQEHQPGYAVLVDWPGDVVACVRSDNESKPQKAHFFVGCCAFSGYAFSMAFPDEKQRSWSLGHIHMLEYFGKKPRVFVPDNCRTATTITDLYEPERNAAYKALGDYYNIAILPARVRRPRDKSGAESTVKLVETWIIQKAEDRVKRFGLFVDFDDLNRYVFGEMEILNAKPFQKRPGSRASVFREMEKPAMSPLPEKRFDILEFKPCTVNNTYHVSYLNRYYSVPYTLFKQKVTIQAGLEKIKIYDKQHTLVATHRIKTGYPLYSTEPTHMPVSHQEQAKYFRQDGEYYRKRAKEIGVNCFDFIDKLLKRESYEETAYKSCQGVISNAKNPKVGADRVELACAKCIQIEGISYKSFKSIIAHQLEVSAEIPPEKATPDHENLRNPEEFV
jgi:transposase